MANSRKQRPKTRAQMRKKVEEIVLTEEDVAILDSVWDKMRRQIREKHRRRREQERKKKTAGKILDLAREHPELLEALLQEWTGE